MKRFFAARRDRLEWTIALTLFFVLCYGAFCKQSQTQLADDVLRLRVVANSDSEYDQAVKLQVRDRVLQVVQPLQEQAQSRAEMTALLRTNMQNIVNTAQAELLAQGSTDRVTACLVTEWYPTRDYDSFALPAGEYTGIQLRIGAAAGHNWWCVVYPSLCVDAASAEEQLSEDEAAWITRSGTEYRIRFRTAELLGDVHELLTAHN